MNSNKRVRLSTAQHLKTLFFNGVQRALFLLASCLSISTAPLKVKVFVRSVPSRRLQCILCDFTSTAMSLTGQALKWEGESLVKYKFPTAGRIWLNLEEGGRDHVIAGKS